MRCLLDKVTARYTVQGLLRLAENRNPSVEEMFALDFLSRSASEGGRLFITPPAFNILQKLAAMPNYSELIYIFLNQTEVALPSRYFKRWSRQDGIYNRSYNNCRYRIFERWRGSRYK